jgi:hypothetical protein
MKNGFTLSEVFSATPSEVYNAWLNSDGHSAMTGSSANVDGKVGGENLQRGMDTSSVPRSN